MTKFVPEERPVVSPDDVRNRVAIYGTPISHSVAPSLFDVMFPALGLPKYKYSAIDCKTLDDPNNTWTTSMALPSALGSCVTMPLKLAVMDHLTEITPQAKLIGSVNTTYFRTLPDGTSVQVGTNLDTAGVGNSLLTVLTGSPSPFPEDQPLQFAPGVAAGLMIGGGGATRAAIYAMNSIGISPIFLINRDATETAAIISQFNDLDLRPLENVEAAKAALAELDKSGVRLAAGVGAIPSIEPVTEAEKMVYEVAKAVFEHPYDVSDAPAQPANVLSLPSKPVHLEMAYKPRMTLIRKIAEDRKWQTICGVEVVLEGCFEQTYAWTGKIVPLEVREAGRKVLRAE
ncbi:3-dehydroquinate synthase [Pseudohyphozyma bogoriensis]|nr:3-dehydroquinate synthase [Pseudohyphozyma bogoriensis]